MEEKSLKPQSLGLTLIKHSLWALPLALPILSIMHFDGMELAEIDLGDPVNLYTDVPLPMSVVSWALIVGLVSAFTPFKRLSSLAVGLAIGGILFYSLDQYEQLKDMEEMGLSSKPLMELVTLTDSGRCLIASVVACVVTQVVYAFAVPIARWWKHKGRRKK